MFILVSYTQLPSGAIVSLFWGVLLKTQPTLAIVVTGRLMPSVGKPTLCVGELQAFADEVLVPGEDHPGGFLAHHPARQCSRLVFGCPLWLFSRKKELEPFFGFPYF